MSESQNMSISEVASTIKEDAEEYLKKSLEQTRWKKTIEFAERYGVAAQLRDSIEVKVMDHLSRINPEKVYDLEIAEQTLKAWGALQIQSKEKKENAHSNC